MNLNKNKKIVDGIKDKFLSILKGMLTGGDPLNIQDSRKFDAPSQQIHDAVKDESSVEVAAIKDDAPDLAEWEVRALLHSRKYASPSQQIHDDADDDADYQCLFTFSEHSGLSHDRILNFFYNHDPESAEMFKSQVLENLGVEDISSVDTEELFKQLNDWLSEPDKAVLVSEIKNADISDSVNFDNLSLYELPQKHDISKDIVIELFIRDVSETDLRNFQQHLAQCEGLVYNPDQRFTDMVTEFAIPTAKVFDYLDKWLGNSDKEKFVAHIRDLYNR